MKVYFTSQDNFLVSGTHVCAFDHEREYRKRVGYNITVGVMEDNALMRVRDVVATVKNQTTLTRREEDTLTPFVSSRRLTRYGKCPEDMSHFVVLECLKAVERSNDDGDDKFLSYDSYAANKDQERILIFSSYGMRQRAAIAKEIFADGTYRTASNAIATLYAVHTAVEVFLSRYFSSCCQMRKKSLSKELLVSSNHSCIHLKCQVQITSIVSWQR